MLNTKDQKNITYKTITTSSTTPVTTPLNDAAQTALFTQPVSTEPAFTELASTEPAFIEPARPEVASTECSSATAATTMAPAVSSAATEPKVQLRQVSWYKRRRPDPLEQQPQVQQLQVTDFHYEHNSSCHVRVHFADGRQLALVGRVLLNQQNGRWAIQALSAIGDQIILDVLATPLLEAPTANSNIQVPTPAQGA